MHTLCPRPAGRRRVRLAVAGAAALGLAVTSCSGSRPPDDGAQAQAADPIEAEDSAEVASVVVIGDSLTAGSQAAIAVALPAAGYEPLLIDGEPSRRATIGVDGGPASGVASIESALAAGLDPDAWVIALGTNDVLHFATVDEYAFVIAELMSALPDDVPVVWVDVYLRDHDTQVDAFNATLHQQLDARPDTEVAAWSDVAAADGIVSDDGIHPTTDGTVAFADTIVNGVDGLAE